MTAVVCVSSIWLQGRNSLIPITSGLPVGLQLLRWLLSLSCFQTALICCFFFIVLDILLIDRAVMFDAFF